MALEGDPPCACAQVGRAAGNLFSKMNLIRQSILKRTLLTFYENKGVGKNREHGEGRIMDERLESASG